MRLLLVYLFFVETSLVICNADYYVTISHNGPVVLGATISFKAELFYTNGERPTDKFKYMWRDNAIPQHLGETVGDDAVSYWNVSYPASENYVPGPYEVEVSVQKWVVFYWTVTSRRAQFDVTWHISRYNNIQQPSPYYDIMTSMTVPILAKLNGQMRIIQDGTIKTRPYVSNKQEVKHEVALSVPDLEYLSHAPQVYSFWYVDCVYYGQSEGYDFLFNYTQEEKTHNVEVLVVASFEPLPTPEPSTTTVAPTTTTAAPNGTNTTTSPTTTLSTSTTSTPPTVVGNFEDSGVLLKKQMLATNAIGYVPNICMNTSIIPPDPKKIYGYFMRQLQVKAPVTNVTVKGTNWLQHGDLLNLQIMCKGSPPYTHCIQIILGAYNVTGNETCRQSDTVTSSYCEIKFKHYFAIASTYTVLIIINNDVNVNVTQVTVNMYEATKKAQLSVIVVPVVCTIMAVVLIVFGVAYYVQNRRRFVVEVADFHFGHVDADMECKTFRERLREAIMNAFSRSIVEDDNSDSDSECDKRTGRGMWPRRGVGNAAGPSSSGTSAGPSGMGGRGDARGQRYGSME